MDKNPKAYLCKCTRTNEFSDYVFEHWNEHLLHTCECGRKHVIYQGQAIEVDTTLDEE